MPFVDNQSAKIFYEVEGSGPGLLFLHGGGGNSTSWYQQIDHFSSRYACVMIDARGFGRSHPYGPDAGDQKLAVQDVFAVMDALDLERAGLVCQSMGAWTGLRMALSAPERIWAFVGASSPMGIAYAPAIENAIAFVRSVTERGEGIEDAALSSTFREQHPARYRLYRHLNLFNVGVLRGEELGVPASAVMGNLFAPETMIPLERLAAVQVPTLLISGAQDPLVLTSSMRVMAEQIPGAAFEVFDSSGHSPYFEEPEAFNRRVGDFLDALKVDA